MITSKRKKHFFNLFRFLVQLVFFILIPGFYINAFNGIKQTYISIIHNNFHILSLLPQIIEAVAIVPVTIFLGRFFCGWMCAFGTFGDAINLVSQKLFKTKFRVSESSDKALKYIKYFILAFLVTVVWSFGTKTFSSANPWDVFGIIATVGKAPDFGYALSVLTPGFIIFVVIVVGSFFVERFFCRYLCPLGAFFSVTSIVRPVRIIKPHEKCGNCRICTQNCAMGIPLYKKDSVNSGECINCFKCISVCPRKNVSLAVADEDLRPVVAGAMAVTIMTGMYYAGPLVANSADIATHSNISVSQSAESSDKVTSGSDSNSNSDSNSASGNSSNSSTKKLKDGTYQGSGIGFRGATTTVSVTVKNNAITNVDVVSYGDDRRFFDRAYTTVIDEILNTQSTQVDTVSGATFSSMGIMSAVEAALNNANSTSSDIQSNTNSVS
jgi:Polyferredoxin